MFTARVASEPGGTKCAHSAEMLRRGSAPRGYPALTDRNAYRLKHSCTNHAFTVWGKCPREPAGPPRQ
eukprot:1353745-Prymnesium_polylepis.2